MFAVELPGHDLAAEREPFATSVRRWRASSRSSTPSWQARADPRAALGPLGGHGARRGHRPGAARARRRGGAPVPGRPAPARRDGTPCRGRPPPRAGGRGDRRRARGYGEFAAAAGRARRRGVPARLRGRAPLLRRPAGRRTGPAAGPRDGRARGGRPEHRRVRPTTSGRWWPSTSISNCSPTGVTTSCAPGRTPRPRWSTAQRDCSPAADTQRQHERYLHHVPIDDPPRRCPCRRPPASRRCCAVQAGGRAADWTAAHRDALRHAVLNHGAVLVRGLGLRSHAEVGDVFRAFSGGRLLPERESFAPRAVHQPGRVRLHEVARQPADVHAPRAELRHATSRA